MTAYTLPEYAKTLPGDMAGQRTASLIELFPEETDILGALPFKAAPGGSYRYSEEGELPTNMAFRGINETPTTGFGVINDRVEMCFPMAGNVDVDRVLINRHGSGRRAREEQMQIKRKAHLWSDTFINGDNGTEPREFTGMKQRLQVVGGSVDGSNYDSRVFANSTASGGGALSFSQLDIAIGLVDRPTHIILPKILKDRLPAAARNISIAGHVTQDKNEMGTPVMRYNGLELLTGYGITKHGAFLNFNEVGFGGGAAQTASIYIVRFAEDGVCGLETSPMEITDIGLTEAGVHYRLNIEHDSGMCIEDPYSALRMSSITNAAIVA